jgi:hypothetical protein
MEPDAWGYNWATQSLRNTNTGTSSSRLGGCYVKIIVAKSKGVKTGCNLAEFSDESCGSKRAAFQ